MSLAVVSAGCGEQALLPPTISLSVPKSTLTAGDTIQISADVREKDGTVSREPLDWNSSDEAVATADVRGRVTARSPGRVRITVSARGTTVFVDLTVIAAPPPGAPESTFLAFQSDYGEYVGQGTTVRYRLWEASWTHHEWRPHGVWTGNPREIHVTAKARDAAGWWWTLTIAAADGELLKPGTYHVATDDPFSAARFSFGGTGRSCNRHAGWLTIHDLAVGHDDGMHRLHVSFEQRCEGSDKRLRGELALLLHPLR